MLNVYLSGEIHSNWREEIIDLAKKKSSIFPFRHLLRIMKRLIIVVWKF